MSSAPNVHPSSHPLIMHKITQMRKAKLSPKYLNQLLKEVSLFLCYEATASLPLTDCQVTTSLGVESGRRLAERIGIVPILRGGLGMVEAMTEIVSNAQACAPPPPGTNRAASPSRASPAGVARGDLPRPEVARAGRVLQQAAKARHRPHGLRPRPSTDLRCHVDRVAHTSVCIARSDQYAL